MSNARLLSKLGAVGAALFTVGLQGGDAPGIVKDFGAVGDGTTDDTVAVQRAFTWAATNGKTLYIPSGVYRLYTAIGIGNPTNYIAKGMHIMGDGKGTTFFHWDAAAMPAFTGVAIGTNSTHASVSGNFVYAGSGGTPSRAAVQIDAANCTVWGNNYIGVTTGISVTSAGNSGLLMFGQR